MTRLTKPLWCCLYLGLHDVDRAWKGFDWEAMNRLHEQGYITDPRGKAKSVVFTEEGFERAQRLLEKLFGKQAEPTLQPTGAAILVPAGAEPLPAAAAAELRRSAPKGEAGCRPVCE